MWEERGSGDRGEEEVMEVEEQREGRSVGGKKLTHDAPAIIPVPSWMNK